MSTEDKDIREQAALWADRLHGSSESVTAAQRAEFEQFASNPRQEREFLVVSRLIAMVPELASADRDRWEREAAAAQPDERTHSRRQVIRWAAIAASVLVTVGVVGYYAQTQRWFGGESYVTRAGESRTVTFNEGSVAYLNTRTEVRWVGTAEDRRVELTEGEALFDVVHDEKHPFRVTVDSSEIRVLGTRFNVYRKPNGHTTVTVLEGTVEVRGGGNGSANSGWVRTLHANEQIEYRSIGLLREPRSTQAQNAVLWRNGTYRFENETVEAVLDELTRYTDQRIVIRDPRIADKRINGAIKPRDVRDSLRRLQQLAPIEVKENNNTFTLDYRAGAERGKD